MKKDVYLALFRTFPMDKWRVTFPDLPGCEARAESLDAAFVEARRALARHLDDLRESAPQPRSAPQLLADARGDWLLCRQFTDALLRPVEPADAENFCAIDPVKNQVRTKHLSDGAPP